MTNVAEPDLVRDERDARITAVIDEQEVVRRHTGQVAWPTVLLCSALVVAHASVIAAWAVGVLPLWAGCLLNAVVSYAFYTVHHDANHKAISGRNQRWLWLDTVCGSIAALPLQLNFKGFSGIHLRHHANTNDPARDPDIFVAGPLWMVPVKWLLGLVFGIVGALPRGDHLVPKVLSRLTPPDAHPPSDRQKADAGRMRRYSQIGLVVLLATIPLGLFVPAFFLWWFPGRLATLALMVLFQWLPHMPYSSAERFHNTRITTFRGSTYLLLQQDRHLIHHLYPSIPWYRYRAVFREVRPLLEAEGALIEGRDSHPHRRIQLEYAPAGGQSQQ